jgi:hypothetical protein
LLHPLFVPCVLTCVLIGGLGIRLGVAVFLPIEPMSDSAWHVARATDLAAGMGYQEGGYPTAYWPVGWPAILAGAFVLAGSMPVAIVGLNLLGAAAIMLLLYSSIGTPKSSPKPTFSGRSAFNDRPSSTGLRNRIRYRRFCREFHRSSTYFEQDMVSAREHIKKHHKARNRSGVL